MEEACWRTKQWLKGHCTLLLFDDFWSAEDHCGVLGRMAKNVPDFSAGSCVVLSARDWDAHDFPNPDLG